MRIIDAEHRLLPIGSKHQLIAAAAAATAIS
jgi:hypothetical protein